ncbi:unnamed protein product [Penicillium discolor]
MPRSELVRDMELPTKFYPDSTHHYSYQPDYSSTGARYNRKEIWKKDKMLGRGAFGMVWLERCLSGNIVKLRAVKIIAKDPNPLHQRYCDQELDAIAKFSQMKYDGLFVRSIGWFENEHSLYIAMEHIKNGDLHDNLKGPLPEVEIQQISFQILRGLQHLHDNQFIHRDLKPKNIFVMSTGPQWWVKIGDFGVSKRFSEDAANHTQVGTPRFMAPEMQHIYPPKLSPSQIETRRLHFVYGVDIWSLGVMVCYMLSYNYPFPTFPALHSYIQTSSLPSNILPFTITPQALSFLKALLAADAMMRPSAKEALENAWLQNLASFDLGLETTIAGLNLGTAISGSSEASNSWNIPSRSTEVSKSLSTKSLSTKSLSTKSLSTKHSTIQFPTITKGAQPRTSSHNDKTTLDSRTRLDSTAMPKKKKPNSLMQVSPMLMMEDGG